MQVVAGTHETRTRHSTGASASGVLISMGVPATVALFGIAAVGWGAISWVGALVSGAAGAVGLWLTVRGFHRAELTRMRLLDLLGSVFMRSRTEESVRVGFIIHCVFGAFLGVAWAYGAVLLDVTANWHTGLVWGVFVWGLALVFMTSIGGLHPEIRDGRQDDPGPATINYGGWTPAVYLAGHAVYGVLLGGLYQLWPLA